MSDEFVDVILGKLVEALRPSPFDKLDEPTLNAGLALISSIQPRSEMEALMAVQIVATGFSGLRFRARLNAACTAAQKVRAAVRRKKTIQERRAIFDTKKRRRKTSA